MFFAHDLFRKPVSTFRDHALRVIFAALDRLQDFPDLGRPTEDADIRQIVIRFGAAGYIVRYTVLTDTGDVLVLRIWHGREART